jgi:hypothetical protein
VAALEQQGLELKVVSKDPTPALPAGPDPHWTAMTERLRVFLSQLPGLEYPYDLGEDPQKILAEYVAPVGYWTEELERTRLMFAWMPTREFGSIYARFRVEQLARLH